MAIGGTIKKSVLFFSKEKQSEELSNATSLNNFTVGHKLDRYDNLDSYDKIYLEDLILGTWQVIASSVIPSYYYNSSIKDAYYQLFFNSSVLKEDLIKISRSYFISLEYDLCNIPSKQDALSLLRDALVDVAALQSKIIDLKKVIQNKNDYLAVVEEEFVCYKKELELLHKEYCVKLPDEIEAVYKKNNPDKPFKSNPLSFFQYIVLQEGINSVTDSKEWQELLNVHEGDTDAAFSAIYRTEFFISEPIIKKELQNHKTFNQRKKYINDLNAQIDYLIEQSKKDNKLNNYTDYLRPFENFQRILNKNRAGVLPASEKTVEYIRPECNEEFINRLSSLTYQHKSKAIHFFHDDNSLKSNLSLFLSGKLSKIQDKIVCRAPMEHCKYVFYMLCKIANIKLELLEKHHNKFDTNKPLSANAISAFISQLNNKKKLPEQLKDALNEVLAIIR